MTPLPIAFDRPVDLARILFPIRRGTGDPTCRIDGGTVWRSARTPDGLGITVSYWTNEESIAGWKAQVEHRVAQETGRKVWYSNYQLRVAKVEREYGKGG